MGNFYTNISLKTANNVEVTNYLNEEDIDAFVASAQKEFVCVFPAADATLFDVAAELSRELSCSAFAVMNHDDDVLMYQLFESGKMVDEYNSCPGYFSGDEEERTGGDAEKLCEAFGRDDVRNQIADILTRDYTFELERHHALVALLGLPRCTVGSGFTYIMQGDAPLAGIDADTLAQTGSGNFVDPYEMLEDFSPGGERSPALFSTSGGGASAKQPSLVDMLQNPAGMKQLIERAQKQALEHKGEIEQIEVVGTSGGGAVTVKSRGNLQLVSIEIKEQALDPDYVEMLEELVLAALNDAARKTHEEMQKVNIRIMSGGFGI